MAKTTADLSEERQLKAMEARLKTVRSKQKQLNDQLAMVELRDRALNDFYFFCKEVMGFTELYEPLHRPLCNLISNPNIKRKLILLPRGHFKTTIISICFPLWRLARDQNERVALCSATDGKAEENLEEIIDRAARDRFQCLFGDSVGSPDKWPKCRKDQVRIKRKGSQTGPSIAAYGVDSSEVGRHFSLMLLDDIVNQDKVNTQNSRDNVWTWFGRQLSVLDPNCEMIVIGTRWHWDDPYSRIQKQLQSWSDENPKGWYMEKRKVVEYNKLIFPTRFTFEELEEIKHIQGNYIYSCFYFNEPVGEGTNPFDLRKFTWLDYKRPEEKEGEYDKSQVANTHILVDPAASEAEYACYSGFIVADALHDRKVVIREAILEKLHPDDLISKIFELVQIHDPIRVLIEDEAYQKSLYYWTRERMLSRNIHFSVIPVRIPRNIQRDYRLSALQPFIHNGQIVFHKNMPGKGDLVEEFETFPKGPHRDLLSAMAMIPYGVIYPSERKLKEKRPDRPRSIEFFEQLIEKGRKRRTYLPKIKVKGTNGSWG